MFKIFVTVDKHRCVKSFISQMPSIRLEPLIQQTLKIHLLIIFAVCFF